MGEVDTTLSVLRKDLVRAREVVAFEFIKLSTYAYANANPF